MHHAIGKIKRIILKLPGSLLVFQTHTALQVCFLNCLLRREISDCQKRRKFCLCSLVTFFVADFGDWTIVVLQVQSVIIALFTLLESNIKCSTVFNSPTKCNHFKVSSLQLGVEDVFSNHSLNFSLQIDERENQRQTARKGAMRIFTPLFEVVIQVQGVLN